MPEMESRQHLPISRARYWPELCLNLAFQRRLYTEALGFTSMEVLADEGDLETGVTRRLRFVRPLEAPAPIRKVFGEQTTLEERSRFDPEAQRWSFQMLPSVMTERVHIHGEMTLEDRPDGTVTQVSRQRFRCEIFGIGRLVEHFIAKNIEQSQADKARFTEAYLRETGLAATGA